MLNPPPHINTHEPWIWREPAQQFSLDRVHMPIVARAASPHRAPLRMPSWSPGELVATHEAYRTALRTASAADPRVVAMEGEPDSSTDSQVFPAAPAGRPIESVIAVQQTAPEQRMVATAIALQTRGQIPFAATFADSWTSAHDLIRMAAIKGADIRLIGSHSGVADDEAGASQVALEDIALFRAIHDSTVLVSSDANQTAALVATMLDRHGVTYLRTLRMATPVIYQPSEPFPIGGSRTVRSSSHDDVTLLGAGATVHEALAAADILVRFGIGARVIDLYSVQPLDTPTVLDAARETGNLIVAEDHWAAGGLGDAVLQTLADADSEARVRRLAVHTTPSPGRPQEHLWRSGIDRTWIATAARDLLEQAPHHHDHRRAHRLARALHR
jgi:transketolase